MMTRQTRHHAARAASMDPDAGLPGPGQALVGFPQPERSLFGVLEPAAQDAFPQPAPPRPRTPQDDHPVGRAPRRRRASPPRRSRNWLQLLLLPLAVLTLGVALGVITVVMLIAAGVPAP
jgi:hypothetical protein